MKSWADQFKNWPQLDTEAQARVFRLYDDDITAFRAWVWYYFERHGGLSPRQAWKRMRRGMRAEGNLTIHGR